MVKVVRLDVVEKAEVDGADGDAENMLCKAPHLHQNATPELYRQVSPLTTTQTTDANLHRHQSLSIIIVQHAARVAMACRVFITRLVLARG